MKIAFTNLYNKMFSSIISLRGRLITLCLFFCTIGGIVGAIATIIQGSSVIAVVAIILMPVSTIILQVWVKKTQRYFMCGVIFAIVLCYILFPIIFFSGGGVYSGMIAYLVLGAVILYLLLCENVKVLSVMAIIFVLIIVGCMLVSYYFPSLVTPIKTDEMMYLDNIVAVVVSTFLILLILISQNRMYKAEQKRADEAMQAKDAFLASMSHELRTPLNAIIGLSEIQMKSREDISEPNFDMVEKINNSGITLLNIINDLLDVSKISSGMFELVCTEYNTAEMINDTVNMNRVRIGDKPIEFSVKVDPNLPTVLYGDDLRMRQILNNMLSNAFKYTNEGTVDLNITSSINSDDVMLTIAISDTGIGVKEEDLPNLFKKYSKLENVQTHNIQGTGLGLSITKELVEMMGGDISVESTYGKGSTFTAIIHQEIIDSTPIGTNISMALAEYNYKEEGLLDDMDSDEYASYDGYNFLVVDDVDINLIVAREILLLYNANVDCVESGQEAIDLISEAKVKYDIIFMDHMMPGMDGIEATRIIHEEIDSDYARNIPIVALTANALVGNEELFLSKGFCAFLSKPMDSRKLAEVLDTILNPARASAAEK